MKCIGDPWLVKMIFSLYLCFLYFLTEPDGRLVGGSDFPSVLFLMHQWFMPSEQLANAFIDLYPWNISVVLKWFYSVPGTLQAVAIDTACLCNSPKNMPITLSSVLIDFYLALNNGTEMFFWSLGGYVHFPARSLVW